MIKLESPTHIISSTKSQSSNMNIFSINDSKIALQRHQKVSSLIDQSQSQLIRKDIYGTPIRKGGNGHKVTFIDKIPPNGQNNQCEIGETILIDNYKEYNKTMCYPEIPFHLGSEAACCKSCILI